MDIDALELIGTGIAGSGGLAGLLLLIRALWKLISGQLAEQRNLLRDAREGTEAVVEERDKLRDRIMNLNSSHDTTLAARDKIIDQLRDDLHYESVRRQQWSEYSSELRAMLIEECGMRLTELPDTPKRDDNR